MKAFIQKAVSQIILLLVLAAVGLVFYLIGDQILKLPFRSANDALHRKNVPFTMDFLIPAGTYIDEKMTIGEVIKIRVQKETSLYQAVVRSAADLIPPRYRYGANLLLFLFWTLVFMTFLRVFTFTGYGRALRASLLLGGLVYYFLPDFSPGKIDDAIFVASPVLIILLRGYVSRRKKKAGRESV